MRVRFDRPAGHADVLAAPPDKVAEVIAGELHLSPRPGKPHVGFSSVLGMDLGSAFQRGRRGPGGWVILDEPEMHLHEDIVVPDLAGWTRERFEGGEGAFYSVAPDWVCEVLSSSTEAVDRLDKMPAYARERVQWIWLADPLLHTIECFSLREGAWTLVSGGAGDAKVRLPPFDAVELDLAALWSA